MHQCFHLNFVSTLQVEVNVERDATHVETYHLLKGKDGPGSGIVSMMGRRAVSPDMITIQLKH